MSKIAQLTDSPAITFDRNYTLLEMMLSPELPSAVKQLGGIESPCYHWKLFKTLNMDLLGNGTIFD